MRDALDSALTSPYGLAVAVEKDTGRFAGVVTAGTILDQVKGARAAVAESISIRDAEAASGEQPAAPADAPETIAADDMADETAAAEKVDGAEQVDRTRSPSRSKEPGGRAGRRG